MGPEAEHAYTNMLISVNDLDKLPIWLPQDKVTQRDDNTGEIACIPSPVEGVFYDTPSHPAFVLLTSGRLIHEQYGDKYDDPQVGMHYWQALPQVHKDAIDDVRRLTKPVFDRHLVPFPGSPDTDDDDDDNNPTPAAGPSTTNSALPSTNNGTEIRLADVLKDDEVTTRAKTKDAGIPLGYSAHIHDPLDNKGNRLIKPLPARTNAPPKRDAARASVKATKRVLTDEKDIAGPSHKRQKKAAPRRALPPLVLQLDDMDSSDDEGPPSPTPKKGKGVMSAKAKGKQPAHRR